jgi:hypothetical protein
VHNHFEGVCNITVEGHAVLAGGGSTVMVDSVVAVVEAGAGAGAGAADAAPRAAARRPPAVRPISERVPVSTTALRVALDRIGPESAAGCREAQPQGSASLYTALMQLCQQPGDRRCIRQCRMRGDMVEICVDGSQGAEERWVIAPVSKALGLYFDQLQRGLDLATEGTPMERGAAEGAQRSYAENPRAVIAAVSKADVAAHLGNLALQSWDDEGVELPLPRRAADPWPFGEVAVSRVDTNNLGNECLRLAAEALGEAEGDAPAALGILRAAVDAAFRDGRNAAVFALPEGGVVVWTSFGWKVRSPQAALRLLFGQCVVLLELALRRVLVAEGGGAARLVSSGTEGRDALTVWAGEGALVLASTGEEAPRAGVDPELAGVHPHPEEAADLAPPTRLISTVLAAARRSTMVEGGAEAAGLVRQKACALIAGAATLLDPASWASLLARACDAALEHAMRSPAPCFAELRDRWLAPRTAEDAPPPALGGVPPAAAVAFTPPRRGAPPAGFYD